MPKPKARACCPAGAFSMAALRLAMAPTSRMATLFGRREDTGQRLPSSGAVARWAEIYHNTADLARAAVPEFPTCTQEGFKQAAAFGRRGCLRRFVLVLCAPRLRFAQRMQESR